MGCFQSKIEGNGSRESRGSRESKGRGGNKGRGGDPNAPGGGYPEERRLAPAARPEHVNIPPSTKTGAQSYHSPSPGRENKRLTHIPLKPIPVPLPGHQEQTISAANRFPSIEASLPGPSSMAPYPERPRYQAKR